VVQLELDVLILEEAEEEVVIYHPQLLEVPAVQE
jgi:hypothetical protein